MSILTTVLLLAPALAPAGDLIAIKVGRAETVTKGVIEHAVVLVDNGKIVAIGPDLPIERGIRVLDRPEWTVMPGLVNPYTRLGVDSRAGSEFNPEVAATPELLPRHRDYADVLELGVTTLGIYPPGLGVSGQSVVIRPKGDTIESLVVKAASYLKVYFRSDARSKKMVKDAWTKVDEYDEKVKKAKEKWTKDNEKSKSKKPAADEKKEGEKKEGEKKDDGAPPKEDEKKDEKKDEPAAKTFTPPEPDAKVKPFVQLRDGQLGALVSIGQSADWLHWLDAIGERKFAYALRVPMTRELDLYEVKEDIGKAGLRVIMEPELTLHPSTMRQRNLPMELSNAGAKLVLIPRNDTVRDHQRWLRNIGELIGAGLDRGVALAAVTIEPATVLGLEKDIGSLEQGKTANMLFLDGDPFEVTTQVKAVMLEGEFVFGEVKL